MKKYFLIIIIFLTSSVCVKSQNISISGKVVDSSTKSVLPFVNISIQEITGTVTDFEGNFNISFSDKYINEKLVITCVGYENGYLLIKDNQNKNNVLIEMQSKDYNINEVIITEKSLYPNTIIKNAVYNIPENYYQSSFNYLLNYSLEDYSDDLLIKSQNSVIKYFNNSGYDKSGEYETYNSTGYKFLSSERNFEVFSLKDGYVNIDDILEADLIKHPNNILDLNYLSDFELELKNDIYEKDSVWIISYKCINPSILNTGDIFAESYSGKITFKKENFVVLKNELELSATNLSSLGKSFYISNQDIESVKYLVVTTYTFENNFYFLKSINYNLTYNQKDTDTGKTIKKKSIQNINIQEIEINEPEEIFTKQYFVNQ
jgi:hypothetical protein